MSASDSRDLHRDLEAAAARIARARRGLTRDSLPQIGDLPDRLEALGRRVGAAPAASVAALRPLLLALLDDLSSLRDDMAAQRAALASRLRAAGTHRDAEAAYRRALPGRR